MRVKDRADVGPGMRSRRDAQPHDDRHARESSELFVFGLRRCVSDFYRNATKVLTQIVFGNAVPAAGRIWLGDAHSGGVCAEPTPEHLVDGAMRNSRRRFEFFLAFRATSKLLRNFSDLLDDVVTGVLSIADRVMARVVQRSHDYQVLDAIVLLVPVDVMDDLSPRQFPAYVSLHQCAMDEYGFIGASDRFVEAWHGTKYSATPPQKGWL